MDAAVKDGNGVFIYDTRNGRTTILDNDARIYNRLTWNEEGTALAVLKGLDVDRMRERDNMLLAFPDVTGIGNGDMDIPVTQALLDPKKAAGFPSGSVISDRATLSWSDDNKRVFFGIKEQVAAPDTTWKTTDEQQDVDVWRSVP